jgi:Mg/Co/Ni transporter MgtE
VTDSKIHDSKIRAAQMEYDALVDARAPEIVAHQSDAEFESDLRQLQISADAILVSPAPRDRRFRFFNALFYRLENLLHRLALKYVNQSAGKQIVFNIAAANVIATLARRLEQNQARTQELENQVRALRERVVVLEQSRDAESAPRKIHSPDGEKDEKMDGKNS